MQIVPQYLETLNGKSKGKVPLKAKRSGKMMPKCNLSEHEYYAAVAHAVNGGKFTLPIDAKCEMMSLVRTLHVLLSFLCLHLLQVFTETLGKPSAPNAEQLNDRLQVDTFTLLSAISS